MAVDALVPLPVEGVMAYDSVMEGVAVTTTVLVGAR